MNVFIIAAVSLDGFIAEKSDQTSTDWTSKADKKFFRDRTKQAKVMVMGRKTFETIGRPLPGRLNLVYSRSQSSNKILNARSFELDFQSGSNRRVQDDGLDTFPYLTSLEPQELVAKLEQAGFDELAVCGGASIYHHFLQAGVVNSLYLTIEPVIFGSGVKLVGGQLSVVSGQKLILNDVQKLGEEGTVLLSYRIEGKK